MSDSPTPDRSRLERGEELAERLSPGIRDELSSKLGVAGQDLLRYTFEFPFGDIYSRPGLDVRSRQIATVSALVTLGAVDQLRLHLRICLTIGMSHEEIAEIITQLAVYAGWPRAMTAMTVAAEIFAEAPPQEGGDTWQG